MNDASKRLGLAEVEAETHKSAMIAIATDFDDASLISVLTLVIWFGCTTVGLLGLVLPHQRLHDSAVNYPVVHAELVDVDLTSDTPSAPAAASFSAAPDPLSLMMPPGPPKVAELPQAPPLALVANPSSSIAFFLPVGSPAKEAAPNLADQPASQSGTVVAPATIPPPVQTLAYGKGEGRQIAPEYPSVAVRMGQEGAVRIRFYVDESGKVMKAEAIAPSPWPLLNEAALQTVIRRWRFAPGARRLYEVLINFQLTK